MCARVLLWFHERGVGGVVLTVDDTTGDRKELGGAASVAALWRSLGGCKAFDEGNQVHLGRVECCLVHNLEGEVGSVKGLPECCSGDAKLLSNVSLHSLCGEREGHVTREMRQGIYVSLVAVARTLVAVAVTARQGMPRHFRRNWPSLR